MLEGSDRRGRKDREKTVIEEREERGKTGRR